MATFHGRYFQVALDAIEQFDRAENLATLSNQLGRAASSFGYQFLCCFIGSGCSEARLRRKNSAERSAKRLVRAYQQSNFKAHDPVAASIRSRMETFRWADVVIPTSDPLAQKIRMKQCRIWSALAKFAGNDVRDGFAEAFQINSSY